MKLSGRQCAINVAKTISKTREIEAYRPLLLELRKLRNLFPSGRVNEGMVTSKNIFWPVGITPYIIFAH